jgi:ABC-type branched-subunit amino acid transport system substrate-binding protein
VIDGARAPAAVADEVGALVAGGVVDAVVGWHISAVRQAVLPRVTMRVPYVYTAMYEGGEHTPGVFLVGETPDTQLLPAMRWLKEECGIRRWCIVGNDYVWPRRTSAMAHEYVKTMGGVICDQAFVPLGTECFADVIGRLNRTRANGLIMLLVGQDAVHFNRAFADAGLDQVFWRLSTCVDENTLLASGVESTSRLCATAAYFETLATLEGMAFGARYAARFGAQAPPLNSIGESCYEGMLLLNALVRKAGSLDVRDTCRAAVSLEYEGPRGDLAVRNGHLDQRIYLAEANGLGFDVMAQI